MRRPSLLGVVSRIAYETTLGLLERELPGVDGLPYFVSSLQLWGTASTPIRYVEFHITG